MPKKPKVSTSDSTSPEKKKLPPYVVKKGEDWYVRIFRPTEEFYENGKRVYQQFKQKCEPKTPERALEILASLRLQAEPRPRELVGEFLESFLETKQGSVTQRTYEHYLSTLEKIKTYGLARLPLASIDNLTIQKYYDKLKKEMTPDGVHRIHTLLTMAFKAAVRWKLITENPCTGSVRARRSQKPIDIIPNITKFSKVVREKYPVLAFALETGMRPGEYLALRWSDIDLKQGTATVARAVTFIGKGYEYKEPKTRAGSRTVHLSEVLCEVLAAHRLKQEQEIERLKEKIEHPKGANARKGINHANRLHTRRVRRAKLKTFLEHDLVFPSRTGGPLSPISLGRTQMAAACKEAGLEKHSLYSLRHSCATLSIKAGVDLKTISAKLGHANISQTLAVYVHVLPSSREDAATKIADVLYKSVVK